MSKKVTIVRPGTPSGLFGTVWQAIRAIEQAPNRNYYIDFSTSVYITENKHSLFDDFFCQPFCNRNDIGNFTVDEVIGNVMNIETDHVWDTIVPNTEEEIQKRRYVSSNIIERYFKLLPSIQAKVDFFVENNFKNKKILGIHLRGTDHPWKKDVFEYMETVEKKLKEYDKLFVCSDEDSRFKHMAQAFKDKVVSYDSLRSSNTDPLHGYNYVPRINSQNFSFDYQYTIAEDVIVEAHLMSKVDFLLCSSGSNVNFFSRAMNPTLKSHTMFVSTDPITNVHASNFASRGFSHE